MPANSFVSFIAHYRSYISMTAMRGAGSRQHNWVAWEHAWFQPSARVATHFMPSSYPAEGPVTRTDKSVNGQTNRRLASNVCLALGRPPLGVCLEDSRTLTVAFMVSGWWLLAAPWIGACLGFLFAMWLYRARHRDDPENQRLSGA